MSESATEGDNVSPKSWTPNFQEGQRVDGHVTTFEPHLAQVAQLC